MVRGRATDVTGVAKDARDRTVVACIVHGTRVVLVSPFHKRPVKECVKAREDGGNRGKVAIRNKR
jgi:hypothetical protein